MIYNYCRRCSRKLKNEESQKRGYGPSCFKKVKINKIRYKTLKDF